MVIQYPAAHNQVLVKKLWKGEQLTPQEEEIFADVFPKSQANLDEIRSWKHVDFYLGTSMRKPAQYALGIRVYNWLVKRGKTVFPPMFVTAPTRLEQSELETDNIQKAEGGMIAVYGMIDTFGIDSEVTETLISGKDAYILLPGRSKKQDQRLKIFRDVHPRTILLSGGNIDGQKMFRGPHVMRNLKGLEKCLTPDGKWDLDTEIYRCNSCESILKYMPPSNHMP